MESSTVLAFRIFVMLACLIVVPMAAIFGSAFPDVVKTVLVDRIVALGTGKTPEAPAATATATPAGFAEVTSAAPGNAAATGNANWDAPRWGTQGTGGVVPAAATAPSAGNQPAGYPPQRAGAESPYQPGAPAKSPFSYPASGAMPPHDAVANQATPQPVEQPDRFTAMERKLREYGATYYLLETWGKEGELYRFHCKMAVGNNPNYTRQFEATDRDALRAIAQVLERVEAWRAGRMQ